MNIAHDNSFPRITATSIFKRQNVRRPLRGFLVIPPFCKVFGTDRTKMFHVKHFGTIDGLRKRTSARRSALRSGDLVQAEEWCRVYFLAKRGR
jgi:hypothetical protein